MDERRKVVKCGTQPYLGRVDGRYKIEVGRKVRIIPYPYGLGERRFMAYVSRIENHGIHISL